MKKTVKVKNDKGEYVLCNEGDEHLYEAKKKKVEDEKPKKQPKNKNKKKQQEQNKKLED